jgi:hypothetical protein
MRVIDNRMFADDAAYQRWKLLSDDLQDMLVRWSHWYRRRIDVDIIESVINSNAARQHAAMARTMFAGWPTHEEVNNAVDPDSDTGTA